jgi:hypothetical protein
MHDYLQPQYDGLPMRPYGPWVAEKLDYLGRNACAVGNRLVIGLHRRQRILRFKEG